MLQFLVHARREGQSLWRVFWAGGALRRPPETAPVPIRPDVPTPAAMVYGVGLPWNLLATVAVGIWLMFAPAVFGTYGIAADSDHLVGALIVTVAVIALADVGRPARFINVLFGVWVVVSPWMLSGTTGGSTLSDVIVGALVIALSLRRGPVGERYGDFDRYIR